MNRETNVWTRANPIDLRAVKCSTRCCELIYKKLINKELSDWGDTYGLTMTSFPFSNNVQFQILFQ